MITSSLSLQSNHEPSNTPYLTEHIHTMRRQEETTYKSDVDYLGQSLQHSRSSTIVVTPADRKAMCTWSYNIVDTCRIDRSIAAVAISYFDRFMGSSTSDRVVQLCLSRRREFQLAFIACFVIALKAREGMTVDSMFVTETLCQGMYHQLEIAGMEEEVLMALEWRLNGPTPQEFVHYLLELFPTSLSPSDLKYVEALKETACEFVELGMLDYSLALQKPSSLAFASVLLVMQSLSSEAFNPAGRMAWIERAALVAGLHSNDLATQVVRYRLMDVMHEHEVSMKGSNNVSPRRITGVSSCSSIDGEINEDCIEPSLDGSERAKVWSPMSIIS